MLKSRALRGLLFALLLSLLQSNAVAVTLRLCQTDAARYGYRMALLQLLLDKTSRVGEHNRLLPWSKGGDPAQDRCLGLLREREVDVVYLPPTPQRLAELAVIPIDLHQGMLGYRLLLINRKDTARFADVHSLADLRQLKGGFGRQWSDFVLFERNQLPVVGANNSKTLMAMLEAGRFDYFHRGLHEAWAELAEQPAGSPLIVEPHLALHYAFPVYLMLHPDDRALHQRLQRAFELVLADGSFKALFVREFGDIVQRAQLKRRTIIELDFPLPSGLPAIDSQLWLGR
ncbi:transporter substrate-binding domain-containing protein [Paucibacter sp. APW11]|uniref:Transporter substrate-binding domain-containing protein n=1 Tax=Roseateles aquae TaxID=3077235 RepID=A0ABU3P7S6_9BURK|nr:transporter substrate-binding domain-containing protein [Paucibacter sp. APW11]MDT8998594.1 transporter substrate-binding domain-containing protein [Paucibacter sp. APW11]